LNRLWLKFALLCAGTATLGIVLAAVFVRQAMSTAFSHYLQDARGLGQMRGMMGQMIGPLETQYLSAVNNYLWIAGVLAVVAAAVIAVIFSRQITAPVSRLSAAAERVKNGDLSQRVRAGSADEVGVLSRDFNAMVDSLETNRDSRRKLMADLAHEMGTPLAVLQSNLEGIMDGLVEASPAQIASLHQETILLSRLVKDLRVLSEADSGRLALISSTGDVAEVVEGVVDAMKNEAARRQIALALEAPGRGLKVNFDRDRVSQVVANLLTNSLRYTPEGGQIKISVRPHSEGRYVLVSVSDTGQGISAEDLPHIFDRFYRGKVGTKRADGSGIGLAVVKELVEAHAGTVWVESRDGEGSTFLFTLPVAN
jgi:two-component system, OmpR family, sensor histidine kinase BaeS